MTTTRRDFIKATAAASAAAAIGASLPVGASNVVTDSEYTRLKWSKAP
jgi:nitrate reductase NapA